MFQSERRFNINEAETSILKADKWRIDNRPELVQLSDVQDVVNANVRVDLTQF